MKIYVAGPIDKMDCNGESWRSRMVPILEKYGKLLHPYDIDGAQNEIKRLRNRHTDKEDWTISVLYNNICRRIANRDYVLIEESDVVFVFMDPTISMCGTFMEIQFAIDKNIPIVIYTNGKPLVNMPVFLVGAIPPGTLCYNEETLHDMLADYRQWYEK